MTTEKAIYLSYEDEKLLNCLIDQCNKDEEYIISEALKYYACLVDLGEKVDEIMTREVEQVGN